MTALAHPFNQKILNNCTLFNGDCLQVMAKFPSKSVDLILCDLPYGTTQCYWDSVIPLEQLWKHYCRIIKDNGAIVLTAMQPFTSLLVASNLSMFKYEWIWEKGNATGFLNAKKQPLRAHESVLVFYKKQPVYNPQITSGHKKATSKRAPIDSECYGKTLKNTDYCSTDRYPRSIQFFSSDKQVENYHPTQKPVALIEYLVRTYTNVGGLVLDNCMGSGTTGVACVNSCRSFIGIEQEYRYFDVSCRRIFDAQAQGVLQL